MTQEQEGNVIHASQPKTKNPEDYRIRQNPPPRTGVKHVQAYNETLAQQMADSLNDQNRIPKDMRPKGYTKNVDVAVEAVQEAPKNIVINPSEMQGESEYKGPTVSSGTTSKRIAGKQNIITAGPKPKQLVVENGQTTAVEKQSKLPPQPKVGEIRNRARVLNVSPQTLASKKVSDFRKEPQTGYMVINKTNNRNVYKKAVGLLQETCHDLLNSENPEEMFEKIKDDMTALQEIRHNPFVFSDCKHYKYLIEKYNEYKHNRQAWQRIRTK